MQSANTPATILHLGLGNFHRAHQAVYLQRLHDAGDTAWRLASGNIRPDLAAAVDALQAQGGAYTLETIDPRGERHYARIEAISQVVPWDPSLSGFIRLGADPRTRIISFTVTEAGYFLGADGGLDAHAPEIAADLATLRRGEAGTTIYGALAAVLRQRMRGGAGPVTLLCCDNLRRNGQKSRGGLVAFLERLGDADLLAWVNSHTSNPNAMVDRITPRPTAQVVERVAQATGRADPCALMAESYLQWVLEDDFRAGRPRWENVGVEIVESVDPYEEAKIRLLNAAHSCIAWAGTLAGYRYIHEGVADPRIRALAMSYATEDVIPVLLPSPVDLPAYRDRVLERFANAAILDTNQRVAADSIAKIPAFIAPTVRDRLARNESIEAVAMLAALFVHYLRRWEQGLLPHTHEEQPANLAIAREVSRAHDPVAALASLPLLWGNAAGDPRLVTAMRQAVVKAGELFPEGKAIQ